MNVNKKEDNDLKHLAQQDEQVFQAIQDELKRQRTKSN